MANQPVSFIAVLCLILAALLGSARAREAPVAGPMAAPMAAPEAAPMPATAASPAEAATAAPAAAPAMDMAPAPGPADIAATITYATPTRSGPPPNCVAEAMGLAGNNAPCQTIINAYRSRLSSNPSMDDAAIQDTVASLGTPSSQCCAAARTFIEDACTCNQQLLSLLPMVNVNPQQIQFAIKVLQASACSNAENGGYITNPCDSTASGTAGRRLLMI